MRTLIELAPHVPRAEAMKHVVALPLLALLALLAGRVRLFFEGGGAGRTAAARPARQEDR